MAESTNNGSFVQPAIPKFDGFYEHWAKLMENFLRSKEYWNLVEDGITEIPAGREPSEAENKVIAEQQLKDKKVKNYLYQAIDREIMETILNDDTSKQIWDSMKQKFKGSSRVKRAQLQTLRTEFEILKMKEGEIVNAYFGRTLSIAKRMKACGESLKEADITSKILRSLVTKFNYVVCSIEESNNVDILTVDELQSSLLIHEQRMKSSVEEDQALKVTHDERVGRGRGTFRGRGRGRGRQFFDKSAVECYKCHNLGHFQYECRSSEKRAHYAEINDEDEMLLMAQADLNEGKREGIWFLDSGCSNHMSGNKEWFTQLDETFKHSVKLGNDSKLMVMGKGRIKLEVAGQTRTVSDVFYVPELRNNLLSIGQLQERGITITIKHGVCKLYHPIHGVIMESIMTANKMFVVIANILKSPSCFNTQIEEPSEIWHRRYGHLSYKNLALLHNKGMVRGLPDIKIPTKRCTKCMLGKQQREAMPKKSNWRATKKLQLIHSDICGPISPASYSKKRYILTFIDDYSRKLWVYFLNEKSEAFVTFKNFKIMVEKECGLSMCSLRTDRGGEFNSKEFSEFCKTQGIRRQLTTAYTPQQNGVAERKNRTILNMVRCLLEEKNMPKMLWPDAVKWTCHVLNRSPTASLKNKTPEECWSDLKPNVEYFKVFGCVGNVHIPDAKRLKLDAKSQKQVLIGYSEESKGYKMINPFTKKITISRDVIFEENEGWDWESTKEETRDILDWGEAYEENFNQDEESEEEEEANLDEGGTIDENVTSGDATTSSSSDTADENTTYGIDAATPLVRERKAPAYLDDYTSGEGLSEDEVQNFALHISADPLFYEQAVKSKKWREAMDLEIKAIEKNCTWKLVKAPVGAKVIGVKWVYRTKLNENGEIDKCKARLVAKGYAQEKGIDYDEVFAPVARWDTIRMVVALAARNGWKLYQFDVKSAFLHGELTEDVYVAQPQGFEVKGEENKVYKLNKALYGLKQAPRAWFSKIEGYFIKEGFEKNCDDHTLFVKKREHNKILIVSLYVDDLIFTSNDLFMMQDFKSSMHTEFEMTDLGEMKYFLGVEVHQGVNGIYISQKGYAGEILKKFRLSNCNGVRNPIVPGNKLSKEENGVKANETLFKQIVGSLMYMTVTRPDIMYSVCLISRFMSNPMETHMLAAKRILRYIQATVDFGIFYKRECRNELMAYTDSDYAGDLDDRKSTSGYVFKLSGGAVAWASKKQPIVTLSSTEAEYVAAASCACQSIWMQRILKKIGGTQTDSIKIRCDNSSTIKLAKNPVFHGRTKHIGVRFHFLRNLTRDGSIDIEYCGTNEQVADIMTKPLKLDQFEKLREALGVRSSLGIN